MSKITPDQLVRYFRSQIAAADALGYTRATVSLWVKKGKLPKHVENHFKSHKAAWAAIKKRSRKTVK
jgi:hypothetical protein